MRGLRRLGDTSGATAMEFALISPLLVMMIVGGFQLAWAMHCAASVRWSLETNARGLMLNPSESAATLKTAMLNALGGKATPSSLSVTITQDTSNAASKLLVATSTYRTTLSVPFVASTPLTFTSVTKVPSP
jgi:Flp pilus assembly protein TadG